MTVGERLALVALGLLLFLPGLGSHDLWNPDEPRYAEVGLEMVHSGHWFVPHLNGRIYSEKPPLFFWEIGALAAIPKVPVEWAARLPSVLAAIATLLLLFDLARRLLDHRAAWVATLVLASTTKFLWQGRVGQIDMTLLALFVAAMHRFVAGFVDRRPERYLGIYVCSALATLTKGPVGLLPLAGIAVFAWTTGRRPLLRELRIGRGLLIWLGIVLAWLIPAALIGGGEYFHTITFHQTVTRFLRPWEHHRPWYYYLTVLPADFFPWSLFLPGALWIGWRRSSGRDRIAFIWALSWALTLLVFFSLSPAKRTVYILPIYPALALVIAVACSEIEAAGRRWRAFLTVPAALLAVISTALPILAWWLVRHPPGHWATRIQTQLGRLRELGVALPAVLLALALIWAVASQLALLAARQSRVRALAGAYLVGLGTILAIAALAVAPRFDPAKSTRPLARRLVELAHPGEPYAIWSHLEAGFLVYTRRFSVELADEADLRAFVHRPGRIWLFADTDDLEKIDPPLPLVEVAREADPWEGGYVLLTSRPPPAP